MTLARAAKPAYAPPAVDDYVLPGRLTLGKAHRGPRYGDDVWEFRFILPRTCRATRIDFTKFAEGVERDTAKEYFYSRLRRPSAIPGQRNRRPMKATSASQHSSQLLRVLRDLREAGAPRLRDVQQRHLDAVLIKWKASGQHTVNSLVQILKHLSAHGPFLTRDRLKLIPWPGRAAKSLSGVPC